MEIEVLIDNDSLPINVVDPHKIDHEAVNRRIHGFLQQAGIHDVSALNIPLLLPKMVRGVAGCEAGCPANAQSLVREGVDGYTLAYVEGGVLTARRPVGERKLEIKIFPDF